MVYKVINDISEPAHTQEVIVDEAGRVNATCTVAA